MMLQCDKIVFQLLCIVRKQGSDTRQQGLHRLGSGDLAALLLLSNDAHNPSMLAHSIRSFFL